MTEEEKACGPWASDSPEAVLAIEELEAEVECLESERNVWRAHFIERNERAGQLLAERDHWRGVAGRHAEEIRQLRRELEQLRNGGPGESNLTWLYENDALFARFARWHAVCGGYADDDTEADEWLMAGRAGNPAEGGE